MSRFVILYLLFDTVALLAITDVNGQDVHFGNVRDMNIWYNPSLKTDQSAFVHALIRSVKYQDITAYTSKAATIELPITIDKGNNSADNGGFMTLAVGINSSSSTNNTVNVSSAMMSLSYALPLNLNKTFLAAGFQGAYTFSRVTYNDYNSLPEKFDLYGPISTAVLADPYGSGYTYQYFTTGAGIAVFHNDEKRQWYVGSSVRHLNRPLTDPTQPDSYRLSANLGIQVGYTAAFTGADRLGGYGNFTWQHGLNEHVIGTQYIRLLGDSSSSMVSLDLGYRVGDALIPGIGFKTRSNRFAFCYEFSVSGKMSGNYNRRSFEFAYMLEL